MKKEINIRELLHRYMEGESTQTEMKQLKAYFDSGQDLPEDLRAFAQMFAIIDEEMPTPSATSATGLRLGTVRGRDTGIRRRASPS